MGLMQEFKDFAMKGNVVDMAVGIVIGGAFGKLVSSFVDNVLMPPIGLLMGGVDFSTWGIKLSDSVTWKVGAFVQTVIDFAIIAFALFMVIKAMNKLRAPAPPPPAPAVPDDVLLLKEIRDLLKK
ncbi:MAG: large-conductance mechanosensitive channel protein MscL [Acidobacteria bacterium]|jgi:large conductance mechanosensitive channel|nr:large-conductance mechanosensitive channel protein MscL [Acidobacteriota bacterium]